jgi:lipopolysaccharide/colanic/teichoic acid biosynthesis glycosyltransferase
MIRTSNNTQRSSRWYLDRATLAAPYVGVTLLADGLIAVAYDKFFAPIFYKPILGYGAYLVILSLLSICLIAVSRNRDFPITYACRITIYTFAVFMFAVLFSRSFYSITLTALAILVACATGAMLSIRVAKFHGDKVLWIGGEADSERMSSLGNGVLDLNDPQADECDIVVVARAGDKTKANVISDTYLHGRELIVFSSFYEYRYGKVYLPDFNPADLSLSFSQRTYLRVKRIFDLGACVVLVPIIFPLTCFTALYILLVSGPPILFKQKRMGIGGVPFEILKFRTMGDIPPELLTTTTQVGDKRIIRGGRFLRRFRLDELPQFWNVFRGDMSLIGPRPEWSVLVDRYSAVVPEYNYRHLVRPGLSGWAQVKMGYASDLEETLQKVSYDLFYIRFISLELDLRICFKTIRALIWRSGAR